MASVLDVGMVAQPNARQKQQLLVAQVKDAVDLMMRWTAVRDWRVVEVE